MKTYIDRIVPLSFEQKMALVDKINQQSINNPHALSVNKHLIAYLMTDLKPHEVGIIRNYLQEKLPAYMIPSDFAMLDEFPLTPNGKIDRKALPGLEMGDPATDRTYEAPQTPTEELLAAIWATVLGREQIGRHDDFFELGGHSLLAVQLVSRIKKSLSIQISIRDLFERPTIAEIAQVIQSVSPQIKKVDTSTFDLNTEVTLEATIGRNGLPEYSVEQIDQPKQIFLTGATGFLGAYLLRELLDQTTADIYCLIRAENDNLAERRIINILKDYQLWDETLSRRIVPVCGDLSKPLLGLSEVRFQQLGQQIEVIYHNGALVNHLYPYSVLKPPNVSGTQEILRLATQHKLKPVHYVSTLGVLYDPTFGTNQVLQEHNLIKNGNHLVGGYNQSKWVAEKILQLAQTRDIPVAIYRPGIIGGHSQTGVWNLKDFRCLLIYGCLQLGYWPDTEEKWRIAPVDYVSRGIVHLSQQLTSLNKTFHLDSPYEVDINQFFEWMASLGYLLQHSISHHQLALEF